MAGSTYGKILTMATWGESHGAGVGVVVDGCPAGLALCEEDVQRYLDRRKPGQSRFTTKRSESDTVEILSGVFEGRTTGTPISMLVRNQDQHSKDYSEIASYYRPGHADYTFDEKYGFRDYRGGGRSSGRETIGRVAAGAIAAKLLESLNIRVKAYTKAIGPVEVAPDRFDLAECEKNKLYMPDAVAAAEQRTVNKSGEEIGISIKGRHDPIIVPRAVVVVETMAAFAAADMLLGGMTARLDRIQEFYRK